MAPLQVDASTEADLETWAVALRAGEIRLWELPPSVSQFFEIGWAEGSESRQDEIDQLTRVYEHKLDTAYMLAYTPKERHEEYQRRLDKYFHDRDAAFFAEPEQLNTVTQLGPADELASKERKHDSTTRPSAASGARNSRPIHRPGIAA